MSELLYKDEVFKLIRFAWKFIDELGKSAMAFMTR